MKRNKKRSKFERSLLSAPKHSRSERQKKKGEDNLKKLNPMVPALLAGEVNNGGNEWIRNSADIVFNRPHVLSDKWIASLNKWVATKMENMSLEDPEYIDGKRYSFGNCSIVKIKEPDHDHTWPSFSLICKTVEGWKLYFKSSKIKNLKVGDIISFNAKVKTSKEGISFLSHVSKIEVRV